MAPSFCLGGLTPSIGETGRNIRVHQPRPSLDFDLRWLCNDPLAVPRRQMLHLEEDHQSQITYDAATLFAVLLSSCGRGSVGSAMILRLFTEYWRRPTQPLIRSLATELAFLLNWHSVALNLLSETQELFLSHCKIALVAVCSGGKKTTIPKHAKRRLEKQDESLSYQYFSNTEHSLSIDKRYLVNRIVPQDQSQLYGQLGRRILCLSQSRPLRTRR